MRAGGAKALSGSLARMVCMEEPRTRVTMRLAASRNWVVPLSSELELELELDPSPLSSPEPGGLLRRAGDDEWRRRFDFLLLLELDFLRFFFDRRLEWEDESDDPDSGLGEQRRDLELGPGSRGSEPDGAVDRPVVRTAAPS
jgi:hypothetical protein